MNATRLTGVVLNMVRNSAEGAIEHLVAERTRNAGARAADLVVGARSGDRDAFDVLMDERIEPAFRTAMAILGHEADARDATQEVFVKAWSHLRSLRDAERFDAWFGRILVNTCRSALRRRYRSQVREIPAGALIGSHHPASRSEDQFEEHAADADLLERAFERLAADDRALLVLHHLDGRPVTAIAAILGIPEGTAKSRLYAARRALERAIEVEHR
jgi:RNA polymerase sigma-70 factor (ECF subfamily)